MNIPYRDMADRTPDFQYQQALRAILQRGVLVKNPFQTAGTLTCLDLPPLVFDFANGFPLITERKIGFWRKNIAEIFAFINGARTLDDLRTYGDGKTWPNFWEKWVTAERCAHFKLNAGDLGPASYGPCYHDFPMPDGGTFNQFLEVLQQMKDYPHLRTHLITTWMPFGTIQHKQRQRKVVVAPCHGTLVKLNIINGELVLQHVQRSADMPVGVIGNILQYAALTLAVAQVLGLKPRRYIHYLLDAQIYEDQIDHVKRLIERPPRLFPTLKIIDPSIKDIFAFRPEHFELSDYNPHPPMNDIPVTE